MSHPEKESAGLIQFETNPTRQRAEALGGEMVELSAHINAAEARFLELVAQFERDELWGVFGCRSCAQWLNWQCGMGENAARERVRVARALEQLPKIRAAFSHGEISYSKVREMTRIAIPESEEALLMIARHGTAAHVQRLVRKYRRVERIEAAALAEAQHRRRYLHYSHDDDGMLVIEARLPPEVGEVVRKALEAAVEALYQEGVRGQRAQGQGEPGAVSKSSEPGGVSEPAEPGGEWRQSAEVETESNVPAGTSSVTERLEWFAHGHDASGVREPQWLPVTSGWAEERNEDLEDLAAWLSGKDPATIRKARGEASAVEASRETLSEETSSDTPPREETPSDEPSPAEPPSTLSAHAATPNADASNAKPANTASAELPAAGPSSPSPSEPAATSYWEPHETPGGNAVVEEFEGESWVESLGARRADAMRLLAEAYLAAGSELVDTRAERYQVVVHIDQALLASGPLHGASLTPARENRPDRGRDGEAGAATRALFDRCELEDGQALAIETARRLACDSALVGIVDGPEGEPLNVGRRTRAISPALRRALRARDGGCRFPGCGRTYTVGHHVEHWANGGETKLSNLVSVCPFHHRLIHEGGFDVRKAADGAFVFVRPDGEPLPAAGRLDKRTLEALAASAAEGRVALRELNRDRGLRIDAETAECRWAGERMDYHLAVGCLLWDRDKARARSGAASI